ncbi:MAG: NUDIX domain-containing protein [Clostridia bacterium]|nr:NUDIX domain-containing protein [Clostridia bacterium]
MIDCAFRTEQGRFYYCVRAVIIREGKLLAMQDENALYYYLPGGKVAMGETAEEAVLREVSEELSVNAKILRALWLVQNFFIEKVKNEKYHELGLYYLLEIADSDLTENEFIIHEGKHTLRFEWIPLNEVKDKYLYPEFVKTAIFDLPDTLKMIIERE